MKLYTPFKRSLLAIACTLSATPLLAAPTVYVPLGSGNAVAEIDAATDSIVNLYEGVDNPHGSVATPDGEYVIAGSLKEDRSQSTEKNPKNSNLFLVHPAHGHVMQTIAVEGWSHHQAITPDGRYVLSTHPTRNLVSVVDVQTGQQVRTLATGNAPYYIVITRDGKTAYVSDSGDNKVEQFDLTRWEKVTEFPAGPSPEHLAMAKDEKQLFVANARSGELTIIPLDQPANRKTVKIGTSLHGLDISDNGERLFISAKADGKLVAYDIQSGSTQALELAPDPYHLNTITGTGKVYLSSRSKPLMWVIDQKSLKVINTIKLPKGEGHQMAIVQGS